METWSICSPLGWFAKIRAYVLLSVIFKWLFVEEGCPAPPQRALEFLHMAVKTGFLGDRLQKASIYPFPQTNAHRDTASLPLITFKWFWDRNHT